MKKLVIVLGIIFLIIITLFVVINISKSNNIESDDKMKVTLNINGVEYKATLEDNKTVKELLNRLPLEITMSELNGNEKYYYFDNSLPTNSYYPNKINTGDIMLYGNNCLVIFYEDFNTSYSYTRIGKIDDTANLKEVLGSGSVKVIINR